MTPTSWWREVGACGLRRPAVATVRRGATSTSAGARSGPSTTRAASSSRPATGATPSPAGARLSPWRGCLALWTLRSYGSVVAELHAAQRAGDRRAGTVEAFRRQTQMVTLDGQGRLTLPPALRERFGIGDHGATVAIEGQGDRLEIRALDRVSGLTDAELDAELEASRPLTTRQGANRSSTGLATGGAGGSPTRCLPDGRWKAPTPPADHQLDRGDIPTCARRPGGSRWAGRLR